MIIFQLPSTSAWCIRSAQLPSTSAWCIRSAQLPSTSAWKILIRSPLLLLEEGKMGSSKIRRVIRMLAPRTTYALLAVPSLDVGVPPSDLRELGLRIFANVLLAVLLPLLRTLLRKKVTRRTKREEKPCICQCNPCPYYSPLFCCPF